MRNIRFLVPLFAFLCFLSCKKDAQVEKQTALKVSTTATELFFSGELDYEKSIAQIQGEKMRMVTPVKNTNGHKSYRYKISEYVKDADPERTGYILSLETITKETNLFSLPINSKGSSFTNSKESSSTKDQQGKIVAKIKSGAEAVTPQGEVLNLYAGCGDLPQLCIDWYYVTYDSYTGNVINEIYVYTTCYDPCSFNSNPSGGGDASGPNCSNKVNEMKSGPVSIHSGIEFDSEDLAAKERTLIYKWTFHKQNAGMWEYRSVEVGTHKQQADNTWKWKSMVHQTVTRHGWTAGGTLSCTVNAAVPQVGLYHAGMQIDYTINTSTTCKAGLISNDINAHGNSPIWHVNQTPAPLY